MPKAFDTLTWQGFLPQNANRIEWGSVGKRNTEDSVGRPIPWRRDSRVPFASLFSVVSVIIDKILFICSLRSPYSLSGDSPRASNFTNSDFVIIKFNLFLLILQLQYRGADKSLARLRLKQDTAIEDFDFKISYLLSEWSYIYIYIYIYIYGAGGSVVVKTLRY
jgi:hypothetical protein